ncbi:MAG TPA: thioredoxin-disulfide reductase [Phycisphaerae bacterium]|jgi:thioredoxin reductase (NADPH)|nr:thioredoxin-disulfide reductase [Phycisphaerae bacterium]
MAASPTIEKVLIIGSGPAGWTAAIYAARANLTPLVLAGDGLNRDRMPGGQLMFTSEVENFPGFLHGIDGQKLMGVLQQQAEHFGTRTKPHFVTRVDFSSRPFKIWHLNDLSGEEETLTLAHAVIISTGASANYLGLPSERNFENMGVSACAVCDGALPRFRDQPLVVVGGGDSAVEEATYLTKFASRVHLVHRRDTLRASKIMAQRALTNPKIVPVWNSAVQEVLGNDQQGVTGVRVQNLQTKAEGVIEAAGMFAAIGHTPNTRFLQGQIDLNEKGYVVLKDGFRSLTSVDGVFAAGDCADSIYRQAITAAGMGCKAAIDAERWLAEHGVE